MATLAEIDTRLDRLEKVVDRLVKRVDRLADEEVHWLKEAVTEVRQQAREADITATWAVGRTDDLGDDKLSKSKVQAEIRSLRPQTVERVIVRGKVVSRIAR